MSGFLAVCVRLSLHRGRGWEGEVSKWFLFCSCLVLLKSFVHDCKTAKCFSKPGRAKIQTNPCEIESRAKIRHRSVMLSDLQLLHVGQLFDQSDLCLTSNLLHTCLS